METRGFLTALAMTLLQRREPVMIIALTLIAGSGLAPVGAIAQERLKVIYSQFTMTNSVTWFAREAGLFERNGLNADLVYVDSTPSVQALTAGQAPIATMSGGLAVGPYLNGLDLVMLAGWCNLNAYQLVARPEIRRPEDLRGKVIGIGRFGAAADWGLRLILRKLGINETKDVQIIQAGGGGPATRLAAMEAKKLDATVLDSPQTVLARRLGFRVLADGVELGLPFLQGGLVTRRAYIRANEDTVRRVVRVIVEAIHYAKTNREAARDPRAKAADPQGFTDMRFVRELEQSGAINQLYSQTR